MDDNAPKENPPADFNKLDLSQLQGFSFGTQWTQEKPSSSPERRDREGGERPRREDRRDGGGAGAPSRDRRTFRRPAGPGGPDSGAGGGAGPGGAPGGAGGHERREFSGGPRREGAGGGGYRGAGGGDFRGGPRREGGYGGGGQRFGQGGQGGGYGGRGQQDRGPYESPYYSVTFYPEDTSFNTLVQTIRKSCRTVELFEIARTVVAKNDRFVVVLGHKPAGGMTAAGRGAPAPAAPGEAAAPAPKPARPMFHISVPDGLPFESDEAAVAHVMGKHLDKFFDSADVEVEPPKGNFQVINKCGITGELLGPPNYHRYNQIVQQHYAAKVASRMGFDAFKSRIETIRDPEIVNQWLAKMKKTTRYTWKLNGAKPAAAPAAAVTEAVASDTPATENPAAEAPAAEAPVAEAPAPAAPVAEASSMAPTFDALEDARLYLLTQVRDKVVRTAENARFHGKALETIPPGEIRRAVEGALERQRRFPLDTANALRGRLRREHFTIFKKGSKGVSYVCAVKRKFRVPGQTFADSIGALISFIESNPMVRASELPAKFLGIAPVAAPVAAPAPAAEAAPAAEGAPEATAASVTPAPGADALKPETALSIDERAKISRLQGDLMWLVREGYVTEFIDGRLFAPPPMVEARKKEIENEEHDPENFPEAPPSTEAAAPTTAAPDGNEAQAAAPGEAPASPDAQSPAAEAPPAPPESSTDVTPSDGATPAEAPTPAEAAAPTEATPAAAESTAPAEEAVPPVEEKKPE